MSNILRTMSGLEHNNQEFIGVLAIGEEGLEVFIIPSDLADIFSKYTNSKINPMPEAISSETITAMDGDLKNELMSIDEFAAEAINNGKVHYVTGIDDIKTQTPLESFIGVKTPLQNNGATPPPQSPAMNTNKAHARHPESSGGTFSVKAYPIYDPQGLTAFFVKLSKGEITAPDAQINLTSYLRPTLIGNCESIIHNFLEQANAQSPEVRDLSAQALLDASKQPDVESRLYPSTRKMVETYIQEISLTKQ